MPSKGRQPYLATVHGEVEGVPFTNWYKYIKTAMTNTMDDPSYTLTVLETGCQYRYSHHRSGGTHWRAVSFNAPLLKEMTR